MDVARVIGTVVCTVKDPGLSGSKLLLVQPVTPTGASQGRPLVAIDSIGSGVGETVFYVTGREASFAFLPASVPADVAIVGIVDSITPSS